MTDRSALAAHLRVFAALGVNGLSREAAWRERTGDVHPALTTEPDPESPMAVVTPPSADLPSTAPVDLPVPATNAVVVSAAVALEALRTEIGPCVRCPLHTQGRSQVVFGAGKPDADLMFVGEAPGADEDEQGVPFVGRAGQLLTKIIEAIELTRDDVYIANVIKCRPPGNRNPEPVEVATCQPFLMRQIALVRPKVIVALGTFAAQTLLASDTPISRLRGQVHELPGGIRVIPTFHPAYLLRSPDRKRDVWEDMKQVRALLAAD